MTSKTYQRVKPVHGPLYKLRHIEVTQ